MRAAQAAPKSAPLKTIVFIQPNPSAINSFQTAVATGEGYFRDEGLEVRTESVDGSAPVLQALAAGQAQIGRPGPAPVLNARARGLDVVFLYNALPRSSFGIAVKRNESVQVCRRSQGQSDRHGNPRWRRGRFRTGDPQRCRDAGRQGLHLHPGRRRWPGHGRIPARRHPGLCRGHQRRRDPQCARRAGTDITPAKFQSFFGNGYAAMAGYIEKNPDVIEGFGRALVRATRFTMDPNNRDHVLKHLAALNPQEGRGQEVRDDAAGRGTGRGDAADKEGPCGAISHPRTGRPGTRRCRQPAT